MGVIWLGRWCLCGNLIVWEWVFIVVDGAWVRMIDILEYTVLSEGYITWIGMIDVEKSLFKEIFDILG